jgi:MoxR-like ATPase
MPSNISKNPTSFTVEPVASVVKEVQKYVVGMEEGLWLGCLAMLSGGHILIEGAPGTGKTLLAKNLTSAMGGEFRRIQMTPDLLPSDIIGMNVYNIGTGSWYVRKGPIFANVVLLDELNRATPRTQAALLEAMQEGQVTIEGSTFEMPKPSFFMATQVPAGGEGTFPLTDVQVDRFAYSARAGMPTFEREMEIMRRADLTDTQKAGKVADPGRIAALMEQAKRVEVSPLVREYILAVVNRVRAMPELRWAPGPRASVWMFRGARALAFLEGREYALPDDVKAVAENVLVHKMRLKAEYYGEREAEPRNLVWRALNEVEVPKE